MARRVLKKGDFVTVLCEAEFDGEDFKLQYISEAAEGINFSYYDEDKDENYEVKYDTKSEKHQWYYDDESPL